MKKQYESPDFHYRMISFTDVLTTSQDQNTGSEIGGGGPGGNDFGGGGSAIDDGW